MIARAVLQTGTHDELLARPWVGASWEGFVIEQILGMLAASGDPADAYFFRTSDGREIDLVLERRGELWAIEVKLTSNPSPSDIAELDRNADLIDATRRVLISRVSSPSDDGRRLSCSLEHSLGVLARAV
jgi:predicted AAA+ superfamily ATPase